MKVYKSKFSEGITPDMLRYSERSDPTGRRTPSAVRFVLSVKNEDVEEIFLQEKKNLAFMNSFTKINMVKCG